MGGTRLDAIAEVTRHSSLKSLRGYIDATAVLAGQLACKLVPFHPVADEAARLLVPALAQAFERDLPASLFPST